MAIFARVLPRFNVAAALFLLGVLATSSADGAVACPVTQDANNAILHLDGYVPANVPTQIYLGEVAFFGTNAVAAYVVTHADNPKLAKCTVYGVLDKNNNLLGWLPETYNYLCLDDYSESFIVAYPNMPIDVSCQNQEPLQALNYHGNRLVIYGLGSGDHIHGGMGADTILGGTGQDDIDDAGDSPYSNAAGALYGEDDGDFLFGSSGDNTFLLGGPGVDDLYDAAGANDVLHGDDGNDCCITDHGGVFDNVDCGPQGGLTGNVLSTTRNCTGRNTNCDVAGWICGFP